MVIVRLHALLLDLTLDIFVLSTGRKWVVGIVLYFCLKVTPSLEFPSLSNVINQWRAGAGVYFYLRQRCRWLRSRLCDVFNVIEVGKRVQVFN